MVGKKFTRTIEVEAVQINHIEDHIDVKPGYEDSITGEAYPSSGLPVARSHRACWVAYLSIAIGWEEVEKGDWIVTDDKGRRKIYPDKKFRKKFKEVIDDDQTISN